MAKNANFWTNGPFSIIYQQDLFKPLGLYEHVKEWKFKRAKEWKCERVKVWKSESVWKCKTVNSDLNTFSFLLNLYLWLNLILNSGAVLHLHLRWRYWRESWRQSWRQHQPWRRQRDHTEDNDHQHHDDDDTMTTTTTPWQQKRYHDNDTVTTTTTVSWQHLQ